MRSEQLNLSPSQCNSRAKSNPCILVPRELSPPLYVWHAIWDGSCIRQMESRGPRSVIKAYINALSWLTIRTDITLTSQYFITIMMDDDDDNWLTANTCSTQQCLCVQRFNENRIWKNHYLSCSSRKQYIAYYLFTP